MARKAVCISEVTVPQTGTGRYEEDSKGNGRRVVKELGKLRPELREKWCSIDGAAENRPKQLFTKNTGLCQIER